jgi:hypothetical protein
VLAWNSAGLITTPKNQVVGLGDDDPFFNFLHERPLLFNERQAETFAAKWNGAISNLDPPAAS